MEKPPKLNIKKRPSPPQSARKIELIPSPEKSPERPTIEVASLSSPFKATLKGTIEQQLFKKFYNNYARDHPGKAIELLKSDIAAKQKENKGLIDAGLAVNLEVQDLVKKRGETNEKA